MTDACLVLQFNISAFCCIVMADGKPLGQCTSILKISKNLIDLILNNITMLIHNINKKSARQFVTIPRAMHQIEIIFTIEELFGPMLQAEIMQRFGPRQVDIICKEYMQALSLLVLKFRGLWTDSKQGEGLGI